MGKRERPPPSMRTTDLADTGSWVFGSGMKAADAAEKRARVTDILLSRGESLNQLCQVTIVAIVEL